MTTTEIINLAAIITGPLAAVGITLWIEGRRKDKDAKLIALRLLLSTRDLPSDPGYQLGVKLVPIEFNNCPDVIDAHREYLEAANADIDGKSDAEVQRITNHTAVKLVRLLFTMSKACGLKIRETDIQTGSFGTRGFFYRDGLLQDSQKAMRDIADILWVQARMLSGETLDQIKAGQGKSALPNLADDEKKN